MQEPELPLSVHLASMSQRSRAVIEYYIKNGRNRYFTMAGNINTANVVMLDYDHPDAAKAMTSNPWPASVALILLTVDKNNVEGAITVRKPLDSAGLDAAALQALNRLQRRAEGVETSQPSGVPKQTVATLQTTDSQQQIPATPSEQHRASPHHKRTPSYFRTIEATLVRGSKLSSEEKFKRYAEKIELLCGPPRTLEQLSDPQDTTHRVDLSGCLSRQILKASSNCSAEVKAVQFKTSSATISVLCAQNKLYSSLSLEYKINVQKLFYDWKSSEFTIIKFDKNSVRQLVDALNQTKRYSFSLSSFCWLGTLFSAQGRLPVLFEIDTPCQLRHWPDLSRLELIPECLEIAAAWAGKSATIPQIIEVTGCEPRFATAFFNAACTLNLMIIDPDHEE